MLWQRVVTALLLLPLVLGAIFFLPNDFFALFIAVPVLLAGREWTRMAPVQPRLFMVLLSLGLAGTFWIGKILPMAPHLLWLLAVLFWLLALALVVSYPQLKGWYRHRLFMYATGLMLLLPAWYAVVQLQAPEFSLGESRVRGLALLAGFVVVWGADIGAYFAGRAFGRHKLAVHVSPGKSVEGAVGGLLLTLVLGALLGHWLALGHAMFAALLALVFMTTLASVLGDLFESMVKREAGLKDSGTLLPGHGGMLDRIDSVTCALPVFALGYFILQSW